MTKNRVFVKSKLQNNNSLRYIKSKRNDILSQSFVTLLMICFHASSAVMLELVCNSSQHLFPWPWRTCCCLPLQQKNNRQTKAESRRWRTEEHLRVNHKAIPSRAGGDQTGANWWLLIGTDDRVCFARACLMYELATVCVPCCSMYSAYTA